MSDTETIQIEERHERQILSYSPSLCRPYTDKQDGMKKIYYLNKSLFDLFRNINDQRNINNNINDIIRI